MKACRRTSRFKPVRNDMCVRKGGCYGLDKKGTPRRRFGAVDALAAAGRRAPRLRRERALCEENRQATGCDYLLSQSAASQGSRSSLMIRRSRGSRQPLPLHAPLLDSAVVDLGGDQASFQVGESASTGCAASPDPPCPRLAASVRQPGAILRAA
jgi:hypothetical protein